MPCGPSAWSCALGLWWDRRELAGRATRHAGHRGSSGESNAAVAEVVVTLLGKGLHRAERQRELLRDHLRLRLGVADRSGERLLVSGVLLTVGGPVGHGRAAGAVDAYLLAGRRERCSRERECPAPAVRLLSSTSWFPPFGAGANRLAQFRLLADDLRTDIVVGAAAPAS